MRVLISDLFGKTAKSLESCRQSVLGSYCEIDLVRQVGTQIWCVWLVLIDFRPVGTNCKCSQNLQTVSSLIIDLVRQVGMQIWSVWLALIDLRPVGNTANALEAFRQSMVGSYYGRDLV